MTNRLCKCLFCAALILVSLEAAAQTQWQLSNVQGNVSLTRNGRRQAIRNTDLREAAILLGNRDMVQTERGTAELRLGSSDANLVLGENTSLMIDALEDDFSLELYYGRMRVHVSDVLTIHTGTSYSVLRNCNAGLDYLARPSVTNPALVVHCFDGSAEIMVRSSDTEGIKLPVKGGESLSLEYQMPFIYVERKNLDPAVLAYWNANPFTRGQARAQTPSRRQPAAEQIPVQEAKETKEATGDTVQNAVQDTAVTEQPRDPAPIPVWEAPQDTARRSKLTRPFILTGIILFGAGAAMQGYSYFGSPDQNIKDRFMYGGYGSMGLGAVFLFSAFFSAGPSRNTANR